MLILPVIHKRTECFTQVHEISAHNLTQFFVDNIDTRYESMMSCVVSYSAHCQSDERFVMIYAQNESRFPPTLSNALDKPRGLKETPTTLFATAGVPAPTDTPYRGWRSGQTGKSSFNRQVLRDDKVIIVREKKIEGRWQLVSM